MNNEKDNKTKADMKVVIDLYHKANEPNASEYDILSYKSYILENIDGFIYNEAGKLYRGHARIKSSMELEDLAQAAREAALKAIDSYVPVYNGEEITPLTYLTKFILEAFYKLSRTSLNTSEYYSKIIARLNKTAEELGYPDMITCPINKLADASGHDVVLIQKLKDMVKIELIDFDTQENTIDMATSPEATYMKKAETELLCNSLQILSDYEAFIVSEHFGIDCSDSANGELYTKKAKTVSAIKEIIDSSPELQEHFGIKKTITADIISRDIRRSLEKLRNSVFLSGERKHQKRISSDTIFIQSDDEDIITAFTL